MMILIIATLVCFNAFTLGDNMEKWETLQKDFWDWNTKISPEFATYAEVDFYNDRVKSYTPAAYTHKKAGVDDFLERLYEIDSEHFKTKESVSFAILKDRLETFSNSFKWRNNGPLNPISIMSGPHINPSGKFANMPFHNRGDFENYLARLQKMPVPLQEDIDNFKKAVMVGNTFHNVSIVSVPGMFDKMITSDPAQSFLYKPFNETLQELDSMSEDDKESLRQRAKSAITNFTEAFVNLRDYIANEYVKATRPDISVSTLDNGYEFYRDCLKWHTSLDNSPDDVHQLGLEEVARITRNMEKVILRLNYNGSVADFYSSIRNDGQFYLNTSKDYVDTFIHMIYQRIAPKLLEYFKNIPENKVIVEEMKFRGPAGMYESGSADGSKPGKFVVNLQSNYFMPTFMLMSLTMHETLPGHHTQWSYEVASSLPKFRKYIDSSMSDVPLAFPFYTAYVEGWGLYAEYLGEEMGLYKDDYELMGRYGSEIFRACRLVVDTGIHVYNWTREEAVNYILTHTSTSRAMADFEVDRYITIPGQACAYKIGEIKIKELRDRAEQILGNKFDIKEFHYVVLSNGPMPLSLLEDVVDDWIKETIAMPDNMGGECVSQATLVQGLTWSLLLPILLFLNKHL